MKIQILQLVPGDRFKFDRGLWTYLGIHSNHMIARRHGAASTKLGLKGYGYNGDPVCSFDPSHMVQFVPVK